jgi:hypothetical protein
MFDIAWASRPPAIKIVAVQAGSTHDIARVFKHSLSSMVDRPHSSSVSVNKQVNIDVAIRNCIINSESCDEQATLRDLSLLFVKDITTMALLTELTILMLLTDTHRNAFCNFSPLAH